jgi:DNA repair protein RecN (Recombination protein N)
MLNHLSIRNYILIEELELELDEGFTVITGETGAGKSILLGALSLILGKRADTDVLLDKNNKCVIEGVFSIEEYGLEGLFEENDLDYEPQTVFRREISKSGKSRAFINDTPVNLPLMKLLGSKLVDIHSQHQTLMLNESGFQMAVLDHVADNESVLKKYLDAFRQYRDHREKYEALQEREADMRAEEDYLRFQFSELDAAALQDGEEAELEEELKMLSHAEDIKKGLYQATQVLRLSEDNIADRLREVITSLSGIREYHPDIEEFSERLHSLDIEMKDISDGLERLGGSIHYDPSRLEEVGNRLDTINSLLQKHKAGDVKALLGLKQEIGERLQRIGSLDEDMDRLKQRTEAARAEAEKYALELRKKRQTAIPRIEKDIVATLKELGMKDGMLHILLKKAGEFGPKGLDEVSFTFSANRGTKAAPISRIASGGELSRLMLAVKSMITSKNLLPTLILDEIDMGVSGDIAGKVARLLESMSANLQLVTITHLPQIAGVASDHLRVFKKSAGDRTVSGVKRLSEGERIDEIAVMLSNEKVSTAARETARVLLGKQSQN